MNEPEERTEYVEALSGRRTTWPYGTRKTLKIEETGLPITQLYSASQIKPELLKATLVLAIEKDNPTVGHLLLGCDHAVEPQAGKYYIAEFTKGGALGGYWKIIAEEPITGQN